MNQQRTLLPEDANRHAVRGNADGDLNESAPRGRLRVIASGCERNVLEGSRGVSSAKDTSPQLSGEQSQIPSDLGGEAAKKQHEPAKPGLIIQLDPFYQGDDGRGCAQGNNSRREQVLPFQFAD